MRTNEKVGVVKLIRGSGGKKGWNTSDRDDIYIEMENKINSQSRQELFSHPTENAQI